MRKREVTFGEEVSGTRLTPLGPAPSDDHGNQRVRVRCGYCGEEKVMRVTAMTHKTYPDRNGKQRKPARSCGCQSKRACREYWEARAKKIRRGVQRQIFIGHRSHNRSFKALGQEHGLGEQLAWTCFRLYAQRLKARGRLR